MAMGGGHAWQERWPLQWVGSMHPTGMHSYWRLFLVIKQLGN